MYVLLIGVNRYESDLSDLSGCLNDVVSMWRFCTQILQIPGDRIRVLTSPALTPERLAGGSWSGGKHEWLLDQAQRTHILGDATLERTRGAMRWLRDEMGDAGTGILHFSGHGTLIEDRFLVEDLGLALTDYDQDGDEIRGMLGYAQFAEIFAPTDGADGPAARLTVTLDCCWSQSAVDSDLKTSNLPKLDYRILVGASEGENARDMQINGVPHGAFTWALTTAMSRWQPIFRPHTPYLSVTHANLMRRVSLLLAAVGSRQDPVVAAPRSLDFTPVFYPQITFEPDPSGLSALPNALDDGVMQLWPGSSGGSLIYALKYSVDGGAWRPLGTVKAHTDAQESWRLSANAWDWLYNLDAGNTVTWRMEQVGQVQPSPAYTFTVPNEVGTGSPQQGATFEYGATFVHAPGGETLIRVLGWDFTANADGSYTLDRNQWLGPEGLDVGEPPYQTLDPLPGGGPCHYDDQGQFVVPGTGWVSWKPGSIDVRITEPGP